MKKYRIVKHKEPVFSFYTIQKRILFWWFNTDIDGNIVFPFLNLQCFVYEYDTFRDAGNALDRILENKKKEIIDEV